MELKRTDPSGTEKRCELLIVPYGIETGIRQNGLQGAYLLIVPYGIET